MTPFSPVLTDMLMGQRRGELIRMVLLVIVCGAVMAGVAFFIQDNLARTEALGAGGGVLGLPGASWACSLLCGLPAALGMLFAFWSFWEMRSGSPDLRWLVKHRADIVSVTTQVTNYAVKHAGQVGSTRAVIVKLKNGEGIELMAKSGDADRLVTQLRAELGL